ncbi:hypothetical protein PENTCL1PPCAC_13550, partial [Pristionchus entomophagus]
MSLRIESCSSHRSSTSHHPRARILVIEYFRLLFLLNLLLDLIASLRSGIEISLPWHLSILSQFHQVKNNKSDSAAHVAPRFLESREGINRQGEADGEEVYEEQYYAAASTQQHWMPALA